MATVELIPATDQDGTTLWQHLECEGVSSLKRVYYLTDDETPDPERRCPLCGEPGRWWPLYRPGSHTELEKIERREVRRARAVRRAQAALAEALK